MRFEILVEGQSDHTALSILMEKIVGEYGKPHFWNIRKHRGVGKIPDDPSAQPNQRDPTLLHNLPSKLRAYGNEKQGDFVVVVLVDLDARPDCAEFKNELSGLLKYCKNKPRTLFRIAIEELEAWFFGDRAALLLAYPNAIQEILDDYEQDSQCGTWEKLGEAIHPGGLNALRSHGKRSVRILEQKRLWAKEICPQMDVENNQSPSFQCFRDGLRGITN